MISFSASSSVNRVSSLFILSDSVLPSIHFSVLRNILYRPNGAIFCEIQISWVCPVPYLLHTGIPVLRASAAAVGRSAPPMVAHVLVALSEDRNSILSAGHQLLDFYAKVPFYANMFSNAGFQLTSDQTIPDALVDNLVISGDKTSVSARFTELLTAGLHELMVSLVPMASAVDDEQTRLMHLIGQL
jgi:hypothetical protein